MSSMPHHFGESIMLRDFLVVQWLDTVLPLQDLGSIPGPRKIPIYRVSGKKVK